MKHFANKAARTNQWPPLFWVTFVAFMTWSQLALAPDIQKGWSSQSTEDLPESLEVIDLKIVNSLNADKSKHQSSLRINVARKETGKSLWLVKIDNQTHQIQTRILWNHFPLNAVKLYKGPPPYQLITSTGLLASIRSLKPFQGVFFELNIPPGGHEYLLENTLGPSLNAHSWMISTQSEYKKLTSNLILATEYFIALFLITWFYACIYFGILKNKHYFFYSTGIFCYAVIACILSGLTLPLPSLYIFKLVKFLPILIALGFAFISHSVSILFEFSQKKHQVKKQVVNANIIFALSFGIYYTFFNIFSATMLIAFCIFELTAILVLFLSFRKYARRKYWLYYFYTNLPIIFSIYYLILLSSGLIPRYIHSPEIVYFIILLTNIAVPVLIHFMTKDLDLERQKLEHSLSLGRSVQDLILPKKAFEKRAFVESFYLYKSLSQEMSGDWIYTPASYKSPQLFFLGDVVGKGPSAAIAVAMIAAIVARCQRLNFSLRQTLNEINDCLYEKFGGQILTTCSAVAVASNGQAELYNASGLGWFLFTEKKYRAYFGRANFLGLKKTLHLEPQVIQLSPGEILMTMTDGFTLHPRQTKKLCESIPAYVFRSQSLIELGEKVSSRSFETHDDQAMIFLKYEGPTQSPSIIQRKSELTHISLSEVDAF